MEKTLYETVTGNQQFEAVEFIESQKGDEHFDLNEDFVNALPKSLEYYPNADGYYIDGGNCAYVATLPFGC